MSKSYHEWIVQSFFVTDKSEQGEFVKNFPSFGKVYTDVGWLYTSIIGS